VAFIKLVHDKSCAVQDLEREMAALSKTVAVRVGNLHQNNPHNRNSHHSPEKIQVACAARWLKFTHRSDFPSDVRAEYVRSAEHSVQISLLIS